MWRQWLHTVVQPLQTPIAMCGCIRRQRQIQPVSAICQEVVMLETQPKRILRVLHYLPEKKTTSKLSRHSIAGANTVKSDPAKKTQTNSITSNESHPLDVHNFIIPKNNISDSDESEEESTQCKTLQEIFQFENASQSLINEFPLKYKSLNVFCEYFVEAILYSAIYEVCGIKESKKFPFQFLDKENKVPICTANDIRNSSELCECSRCDSGLGSFSCMLLKKQLNSVEQNSFNPFLGITNPAYVDSCWELQCLSLPLKNGTSKEINSANKLNQNSTTFQEATWVNIDLSEPGNAIECHSSTNSESSIHVNPIYQNNQAHPYELGNSEFEIAGSANNIESSELELTDSGHAVSDDRSSQHDSSIYSSTWGSSMDGSIRRMRHLFPRRHSTKPLLFFIHGVGGSADIWQAQLSYFKERGFETVAMDLIGHGFSSAPDSRKAYMFRKILTDVIIVFDHFSKDRNVVIGHSYGSSFAAALARQRPHQVSHLVMISGGGPMSLAPQPGISLISSCLFACIQPLFTCSLCSRQILYTPATDQHHCMKAFDVPPYVLRHMMRGQDWPEGDAAFYKQITVPTLLIYGLRDPFVTLVEECEMEKAIPRAFLELIPDASHMVMLEAPDKLNTMIYRFLKRWDR